MSAADSDYLRTCFLCQRRLTPSGMSEPTAETDEDVFPKWLLRLAGLHNARASIPGGQLINYSRRTVPACNQCNAFLSGALETEVSRAVKAGFDEVRRLPEKTLLLWLAKIFYGTRWREIPMRADVSDPAAPRLLTADEFLAQYGYLRELLLSGPGGCQWVVPPGSVILHRAGVPTDPAQQFDFHAQAGVADFLYLRVRDTVMVAVFGDNGHWQQAFSADPIHQALERMRLHPSQAAEMGFRYLTRAAAVDTHGCYDFMYTGDPTVAGGAERVFMPGFELAHIPESEPWLREQYVRMFYERCLGTRPTPEDLQKGTAGRMASCLIAPDDSLVQADCFEMACPNLLVRAGWIAPDPQGPSCRSCGLPRSSNPARAC
jgi:hypothetical protein